MISNSPFQSKEFYDSMKAHLAPVVARRPQPGEGDLKAMDGPT